MSEERGKLLADLWQAGFDAGVGSVVHVDKGYASEIAHLKEELTLSVRLREQVEKQAEMEINDLKLQLLTMTMMRDQAEMAANKLKEKLSTPAVEDANGAD